MGDRSDRPGGASTPQPRDSALGILLRRMPGGHVEVLMARRSPRSRFMPGHLAFPGGRMEPQDEPDRAGAYARCAAREVQEEAGIAIEPGAWIDIGERVTPPMFRVRYRTRFFVAELPAGSLPPDEPPSPEEIDQLRLGAAAALLDEWERGESLLPPPCLPLLRVIAGHRGEELGTLADRLREANALEARLPRIEFVPGIWVLPVRSRTLPPATHTNVWMPGGRRFVVIDPGSDVPEEIERLLGVIERRRELGCEADSVLLTHQHPDHVAGAGAVAGALGLPVRAHPSVLEAVELPAGLPPPRALDEGDRIDLDGLTLRALHTPGHAPGHLAFEAVERKVLIAGDLVSGVSTILVYPPDGEMEAYLASLRRIGEGGYRSLLPSHGPPLPSKVANHLIEHRLHRESLVRSELAAGWRSLGDLARASYRDTPGMPDFLIEAQTLGHLVHLQRQGAARRHEEDPRLWCLASADGIQSRVPG